MEITAASVTELRDKTGAGMMDCKRRSSRPTATSRRPARSSARRASRPPPRRPAAPPPRAWSRSHVADGNGARAGRGQLRDRLRRADRGLPGVRRRSSPTGSRPTTPRRRAHGKAATRDARRPAADGRPTRSPTQVATISENIQVSPLRARWPRPRDAVRLLHPHGRQDRRRSWALRRAPTRRSPRTSRCTSPPRIRASPRARSCRAEIARRPSGRSPRAGDGRRQARQRRREDRRGQGREVLPARPCSSSRPS